MQAGEELTQAKPTIPISVAVGQAVLSATRKRYAHRLANEAAIEVGLGEVIAPNDFRASEVGCIYFAKCGDSVKIGFSKHIPTRLAELSVGSPEPLTLVHYETGTTRDEIVSFIREARSRTSIQNAQSVQFRMTKDENF